MRPKVGAKPFKDICENRSAVHEKVMGILGTDQKTSKKIEHYYKLRCDLIHQRATPNILDEQVEDYRQIVDGLLEKMFGLQLN